MEKITLGSVALDCADPVALGSFWAAVLGGDVAFTSDEFVAVKTERVWLAMTKVDEHRPPSWPEGSTPKQMHLDLSVRDLEESAAQVVALGATREAIQPAPDRYLVLRDPAGHPFCLSTQIPEL